MSARLADMTALVTGAASGLGKATAERFAADGANVVLCDINEEAGASVAGAIGPSARFQRVDHNRRADIRAAVDLAVTTFGALDVVVANAGVSFAGDVDSADDRTLQHVIGNNLVAQFNVVQETLPRLRERAAVRPLGVSILFTASLQGLKAKPMMSVYTASKHGVVGMTRGLALELAPQGIRVNAVCPTVTDTPLLKAFLPTMAADEAEAMARFRATIPLGIMPVPEDIAAAFAFLASSDARMITGHALAVDGGQMAM